MSDLEEENPPSTESAYVKPKAAGLVAPLNVKNSTPLPRKSPANLKLSKYETEAAPKKAEESPESNSEY